MKRKAKVISLLLALSLIFLATNTFAVADYPTYTHDSGPTACNKTVYGHLQADIGPNYDTCGICTNCSNVSQQLYFDVSYWWNGAKQWQYYHFDYNTNLGLFYEFPVQNTGSETASSYHSMQQYDNDMLFYPTHIDAVRGYISW